MLNHNIRNVIQQKLDRIYENIRTRPVCYTCGITYIHKNKYLQHLTSYEHRWLLYMSDKIETIENKFSYIIVIFSIIFYYICYLYPILLILPIFIFRRSIHSFYK